MKKYRLLCAAVVGLASFLLSFDGHNLNAFQQITFLVMVVACCCALIYRVQQQEG